MTTMERFDELADLYIKMAKRNNLTAATIRNYESVTGLLRDFLQSRADGGKLSEDYVSFGDIMVWIDSMNEAGNKASTIKQRLVTANQFFTFATKPYVPADLRYEQSPVSTDFYPKTPAEAIPEALTDEEITALWKYEKRYAAGEAQFARNYALVVLMLTTGLRNKEVLDLTLDAIDLRTGEIFVENGKGRKSRIVDMDNGPDGLCAAALENYLRVGGRPLNIPDTAPLFGTTAGHTFGDPNSISGAEKWHRGSGAGLSVLVERHVRNQTGRSDCRTHDLRHTFARLQLNSTGNLAELQSMLGHSDPKISERYSGRLMAKRMREQTKAVLAARDEAARRLRAENRNRQQVVPLTA